MINKNAIKSAIQKHTLLSIKSTLSETMDVPPLSATVKQILELRASSDRSVEKLTKVIEKDPSLAARIVGWASSSHYIHTAASAIHSVKDAITSVLGYDLAMNIASGIALSSTLRITNQKEYWLSVVWTATLAERIAKSCVLRIDANACYLAGMLHNFGYLVLSHVFPDVLSEIHPELSSKETDINTLTLKHLGITSDYLCCSLLEEWGLPVTIVLSIKHQNDPDTKIAYKEYCNVLFLTVQLLKERGLYHGIPADYSNSLYALGLSAAQCEECVNNLIDIKDSINKIADSM